MLSAVAGTSAWIQYAVGGGSLAWTPTVAAVVYYTVSGAAGIQLLRRAPLAHRWALVAVIPQLLQLRTGHFAFKIVSGPKLILAIDAFGVEFRAGVESLVEVGTFAPVFRTTVVINLMALMFAWYLHTQRDGEQPGT